jgi:hypothetical protein
MHASESEEAAGHKLKDDLDALRVASNGQPITFQKLIDVLGDRGHAVVILLFSAPFIFLPIPGLSTAIGLGICVLSVALIFNRQPWLPGFIAKRSLSPDGLDRIVRAVNGVLKRLERFVKPRLLFVTTGFGHRIAGISMLAAAIAFGLPGPPGNNIPPAVCMTVLALGLLERDGVLTIVGHVLTWLLWIAMIVLVIFFWNLVEPYATELIGKFRGTPTTMPATMPATVPN